MAQIERTETVTRCVFLFQTLDHYRCLLGIYKTKSDTEDIYLLNVQRKQSS